MTLNWGVLVLFLAAQQRSGEPAIEQRVGEPVSLETQLRDEAGGAVTLGEAAAGKPVVLALVYYRCPMLCNLVLNGLLQAVQELSLSAGEQFTVVALSFDPSEGTELARERKAAALKSYGRPGGEKGWRFLTGTPEAVERLCRETGFRTVRNPATGQYAHGGALILLTPRGVVSRYLFGVRYPVRELRLSIVEASAGTVGSKTDQFLLMCMQYDPATGKYGLAVRRLLKGGALVTLVALGVLVVRLSRRRAGAA